MDASEVIALNRKQRNKMSVVKEGLEVSEVMIQEGVHSFETLNEAVAEPVIYMIDRYVVGGFLPRAYRARQDENLNARACISSRWPSRPAATCPTTAAATPTPPTASTPTAWSVASACPAAAIELSARRPKPTRPDPQRGPATAF